MKFTKFIPVAVALTMVAPVFAADAAKLSDQSEMTITVPDYVYIEKQAGAVEAAKASFDKDYSVLELDKAMTATFKVVTNKASADTVTLTGTCIENDQTKPGLAGNGTGGELRMAFTKSGTATPAGAAASALAGDHPEVNKNAIAIGLTCVATPDTDSGATTPTASMSDNVITYTLPTAGHYTFAYTLNQAKYGDTFDTHDTAGTYKSTITMTHAALPVTP